MILLISGFVLQVVLARKLGPELFGLYTLVISILLWAETSVTMGIPSVFQKIISETKDQIRLLIGAVGKYSVTYCVAVWLLFALFSPIIALLMQDARLVTLLLVASLDIPFFGLYATFICMLNGHGQFLYQSSIAAIYSIARAAVIVIAVLLGFGLVGALLGNAIGSAIGLIIGFLCVRKISGQYDEPTEEVRIEAYRKVRGRLITFGVPFVIYQLFKSVLIHMDIWFVKALSGDGDAAAITLGYYAIAYNLARIPYFMISGVTFTAFPAISRAFFENRISDVRDIIRQMFRLIFLVLLPLNALVFSRADEMIVLLFSETYQPAADTFRILFAGISLYTIFMFLVSIFAAENRPRTSLVYSVLLIPIGVILNMVLIPKYGIEGAAVATAGVSLIGVAIVLPALQRQIGGLIDIASLVKTGGLSIGIYFISQFDYLYEYHLIVGFVILGIVYLAGLFAVGEIDRKLVLSILQSNKNKDSRTDENSS